MKHTVSRVQVSTAPGASLPGNLSLLAAALLKAQLVQWNAFISWQRLLIDCGNDLREQWAARYAGGVPIDR